MVLIRAEGAKVIATILEARVDTGQIVASSPFMHSTNFCLVLVLQAHVHTYSLVSTSNTLEDDFLNFPAYRADFLLVLHR